MLATERPSPSVNRDQRDQNDAPSTQQPAECVLILAPYGQDANMLAHTLEPAGLATELCPDIRALCDKIGQCLAILVTEEALGVHDVAWLERQMKRQPPWSDVPILVLASAKTVPTCEHQLRAIGNVTVLQRPLPQSSLVSVVQSAVRARRRQLEVRDLLEARDRQNAQIAGLNERLQRAMVETHHRVKNNLQLISALIDLQAGREHNSVPIEHLRHLGEQVRTLAAIHEILTDQAKSESDTHTVSARVLLGKLVSLIQSAAGGRKIEVDAEDATFTLRKGTSFMLVANELISNAIKYGRDGIMITFRNNEHSATLEVRDDGPGFAPGYETPCRGQTGIGLVESLVRWDLGGTVEFGNCKEGGACVVVSMPIS